MNLIEIGGLPSKSAHQLLIIQNLDVIILGMGVKIQSPILNQLNLLEYW